MGLDPVEELSGYDDVDSDQVFNGGYMSNNKNTGGEGRRRGKKSLAPKDKYRPRSKRAMGRGFSFNFRGFEDTAKAMLAVTIGALVLCAVILYATFSMHLLPDFYGALAASIVVMALLFYTAAKLIRSG
jgi:hypothetical protein